MRLILEPGPEPEVVAEALQWAEQALAALAALAESIRDRVLLVLGEAVANAVRHGRGTVEVTVVQGGSTLSVHVADEARALTASALHAATLPSERQTDGRGLVLIAALVDAWAVEDGALYVTFDTGAADADATDTSGLSSE